MWRHRQTRGAPGERARVPAVQTPERFADCVGDSYRVYASADGKTIVLTTGGDTLSDPVLQPSGEVLQPRLRATSPSSTIVRAPRRCNLIGSRSAGPKKRPRSISETRSEVERSASEIDNTRSSSDTSDESGDLSQIPQLIHDYLVVVKEQQQGKKLRQDLLRSMVGNKVNDLSDGRFSVPIVLNYYDRLNSHDAEITALISSICGGEPSTRHLSGIGAKSISKSSTPR